VPLEVSLVGQRVRARRLDGLGCGRHQSCDFLCVAFRPREACVCVCVCGRVPARCGAALLVWTLLPLLAARRRPFGVQENYFTIFRFHSSQQQGRTTCERSADWDCVEVADVFCAHHEHYFKLLQKLELLGRRPAHHILGPSGRDQTGLVWTPGSTRDRLAVTLSYVVSWSKKITKF